MTSLWTSAEIAQAVGGTEQGALEVNGVACDSREVGAGDLFIAMKGEHTDGHRFVDQARDSGAAGVLVSQSVAMPHVLVADTTEGLNALGLAARARGEAQIIGVTGSAGKTGTKEAL